MNIQKATVFLALAIFQTVLFVSCSNRKEPPKPVNEEEVITTMTVTLAPSGGGTPITLQNRDLDGDGPNAPTVTVSGGLETGVAYNGTIVLLNETENPAENITEEVEEEAEEHQFFYTVGSGLNVTTMYADFDGDGNNLGTAFILTAGTASSGTLTFTLRHEPTKPNTDLSDAGGETDIEATFNLTVQ